MDAPDAPPPAEPVVAEVLAPQKRRRGQTKTSMRGVSKPRITFELYEALVKHYNEGDRTNGGLCRHFQINYLTADKAIHRGWHDGNRNWPALKVRAADYDRVREEGILRAAADPAKREAERQWKAISDDQLDLKRDELREAVELLAKLKAHLPEAKMVETRPVRTLVYEEITDRKGNVRKIPRTVTLDQPVALNAASCATMLDRISMVTSRAAEVQLAILRQHPQDLPGTQPVGLTVYIGCVPPDDLDQG